MQRAMLMLYVVLASTTCTMRARRPDGPYRAAEELTDALSDEAVACTRAHAPSGSGLIAIAAEFTPEGTAPKLHDAGSTPGTEAVIACVRERASAKLRSPATTPAPFVRIRVPLPLVTKNVTYAFVQSLQSPQDRPAGP
jgi:hypothetical protein